MRALLNMAASGATLRVHDLASKQRYLDIVSKSVCPNHCYQKQQTGNNDYCWDRIEPMNAKAGHSCTPPRCESGGKFEPQLKSYASCQVTPFLIRVHRLDCPENAKICRFRYRPAAFCPSRVARRQQARKKAMTRGFHPCLNHGLIRTIGAGACLAVQRGSGEARRRRGDESAAICNIYRIERNGRSRRLDGSRSCRHRIAWP